MQVNIQVISRLKMFVRNCECVLVCCVGVEGEDMCVVRGGYCGG